MKRLSLTLVMVLCCMFWAGCGGELGSCYINCSGRTAAGSPWSDSRGPFADYTEDECDDGAVSACRGASGTCQCASAWTAY